MKINGELAVVGSQATKNYTIIRSSENQIGIRRRGGWGSGDVFIQANIGHLRSIEQRVFIQGSKIPDLKTQDEDRSLFSKGSFWFRANADDTGLHFTCSDGYEKHYEILCEDVFISKTGLISAVVNSNTTIHSHVNYRASAFDNNLNTMTLDSDYDSIVFTDWDEHYWLRRDHIVIRHDVNPFSGESFDMLWDNEDLEDFDTVLPTKKSHALINNKYVINTRFPEIYNWSR